MTTTTTPITIDWDAARRRSFDGGMPVHGDVDAIIVDRIRWNARHADPGRTCPRCTGNKAVCVPVCWTCDDEIRADEF